MAVTASGTQTATVGTEHTLATVTAAGSYELSVNTENMALGDRLELRVKKKVISTESVSKTVYSAVYTHNQTDPVKVSIPIRSEHEAAFTLKQTAGTGRAFNWSVNSL